MPEVFTAPGHHEVLVLVIQIAVLLFSARAMGEVAQRLGQPAVVGEILAGIILGPTLLSGLFPFVGEWILPQTDLQGYLLETVSLLGVMFLLLITGLETDLALIRRHARTALSVSWGGITVTFATGFALGWWLPDFLLADPERRLVFALFIATAMSISAIPVIAKVLMDMGLIRRDIGQTILAAGMNDDTIGWILLGIIAGLASAGSVSPGEIGRTVGSVLVFLVLSFTVGRWLVKRTLAWVQDEVVSRDRLLTLVIVLTFAWGAVTQALELEPVLGAFVMGILFGQERRLPESVRHGIESLALGIFAPIFFAVAGLKVNVVNLLDPTLGAIALLVIFIASAGKVAGTYAGARLLAGKDHWTSLSYGAGLNARGAMEIIIATIGLQLGILGQEVFSMIVLMAMATSLMAPTALRWVLARVEPEEQELERLEQEAIAEKSLVAKIHRVLLPVRTRDAARASDGGVHTVEARILERLGTGGDLSITLLTVVEPDRVERAEAYLGRLTELFARSEVTVKVVERKESPAEIILDEARKDYDLVVLGATEPESTSRVLFDPIVDYIVRVAPCPTMVVQGRVDVDRWSPRRILCPTDGTEAARRASEFGFAVGSTAEDTRVTVLTVVLHEPGSRGYRIAEELRGDRLEIARGIVAEVGRLGETLGVATEIEVREGPDPESVILDVAGATDQDLIVLGTAIRPGSERLYLGTRVEKILHLAPCPVMVVNA